MSGLVESATAVMRMAEQRLEVIAHNVANLSTPGYRRRIGFATLVDRGDAAPTIATHSDAAAGALSESGNPFDLAIGGDGYFQLRAGEATLYSRQGRFRRDPEGRLVTPQGYFLQRAGGGDLTIDGATPKVARDGTMLDGERPVGRIAVMLPGDAAALRPVGESFFAADAAAMADAGDPVVRQGMVEASNVVLGDEMTRSMAAVREAETGARLIQLYDELMGKAVNAFAGNGR